VRVGERWIFIDKTGRYVRFSDIEKEKKKEKTSRDEVD
jgi:hypothetical protein